MTDTTQKYWNQPQKNFLILTFFCVLRLYNFLKNINYFAIKAVYVNCSTIIMLC